MAGDFPTPKLPKMAPGQRYGRLTSVAFASRENKKTRWLFRCDCGNDRIVLTSNVRSGKTQSCGCGEVEARHLRGPTKHGMARTPAHRSWVAMNNRCSNPNAADYPRYGGRGIKVCERWRNSFENFYADMGPRLDGMSLDRYPNKEGNYEPGNCRWATAKQQQRNISSNRHITYRGETMTVAEACEQAGRLADYDTIYIRIFRYGWTPEKALALPKR